MPVTWNPKDYIEGTVDNSNRDFAGNGNYPYVPYARVTHQTSVNVYVEFTLSGGFGSADDMGIIIAPKDSGIPYPFDRYLRILGGGGIYGEYAYTYAASGLVENDRICIAVAPATGQLWVRKNNGNWNNSGTANPTTNTGGFAFPPSTPTSNITFAGYSSNPLCTITTNFESAQWSYSAPANFDVMSDAYPTNTVTVTRYNDTLGYSTLLIPPTRFASIGAYCFAAGGGAGNSRASAGGGAAACISAIPADAGKPIYVRVGNPGAGANAANGNDAEPCWFNVTANAEPTSDTQGIVARGGKGNIGTTAGLGGNTDSSTGKTLRLSNGGNGYYTAAGTIGYGGGGGAGWADQGSSTTSDTGGAGGYPNGGTGGTGASGTNQPGSDGSGSYGVPNVIGAGGGGGGGNSRSGGSGGRGHMLFWITHDASKPATWDYHNRSLQIPLTNNGFTADGVGASFNGALVKATKSIANTAKVYWEVKLTDVNSSLYHNTGVAEEDHSYFNWPDESQNTAAFAVAQNDADAPWTWLDRFGPGVTDTTDSTGVVRFAVDRAINKIWWAVGTSSWYQSGDPVAGTGGYDISALTGELFPYAALPGAGSTLTCRFDPNDWDYAAPAGFTAIDNSTRDGWDPLFNSDPAVFTVTNNRRTLTRTASGGTDRGTQSYWVKTHGKWYYEYHFGAIGAGDGSGVAFVENSHGINYGWYGANKDQHEGAYGNGTDWDAWTPGYREAFGDNDVVCIALDCDLKQAWMRVNNGSWYGANTTPGDPAAGTIGRTVYPLQSGVGVAAAINLVDPSVAPSVTSAFKADQWIYSPPAGFEAPVEATSLTASLIKELVEFSPKAVLPLTKSITVNNPAQFDTYVLFKASEFHEIKEIKAVVQGTGIPGYLEPTIFVAVAIADLADASGTITYAAFETVTSKSGVSLELGQTLVPPDWFVVVSFDSPFFVDEVHITVRF